MSEVKKYEADRSVSFLDEEAAKWLHEEGSRMEDGLCLARFRADFVTSGVRQWRVGQRVDVCGRTYTVTICGKRCFSECRLLQRTGKPCPLADGTAFGRVAEEAQR